MRSNILGGGSRRHSTMHFARRNNHDDYAAMVSANMKGWTSAVGGEDLVKHDADGVRHDLMHFAASNTEAWQHEASGNGHGFTSLVTAEDMAKGNTCHNTATTTKERMHYGRRSISDDYKEAHNGNEGWASLVTEGDLVKHDSAAAPGLRHDHFHYRSHAGDDFVGLRTGNEEHHWDLTL